MSRRAMMISTDDRSGTWIDIPDTGMDWFIAVIDSVPAVNLLDVDPSVIPESHFSFHQEHWRIREYVNFGGRRHWVVISPQRWDELVDDGLMP